MFPAIAVCEELVDRFPNHCRFLFLTSGKKIEDVVLSNQNVESVRAQSVTMSELKRRPVRSSLKLLSAIRQSRSLFKKSKPCVVIGLGGYGSLPGILAAWSLRLPILLMEQNAVPGRANTFLARFAKTICTSFPETELSFSPKSNCVETGNPVRRSILSNVSNREPQEAQTLLIVGGSQGATAINLAMAGIVKKHPELLAGWNVIHQTGTDDNLGLSTAYENADTSALVSPFLNDMAKVLSQSTLVISRAGATTLAELAIAGLPAILVPYPNSVRDHQEQNARYYSSQYAAEVVLQSPSQDDFESNLCKTLEHLLSTPERLPVMSNAMSKLGRADATELVTEEIISLGR